MITPRLALLALALALSPSAARADDPVLIPILGGSGMGSDPGRLHRGSEFKILKLNRQSGDLSVIRLDPGALRITPSNQPIILDRTLRVGGTGGRQMSVLNTFDEYFLVTARDFAKTSGRIDLLSISDQPYPGTMRGEPVSVVGPNGSRTRLWMPSRQDQDVFDQTQLWGIPPATRDNTRVQLVRPGTTFNDRWPSNNAFDPGAWLPKPVNPRNAFLDSLNGRPGSNPFFLQADNQPLTYYTALSNYTYDGAKKKIIGPDGKELDFQAADMPDTGAGFYLAPPAIPAGFRFQPTLVVLNTEGKPVDPVVGSTRHTASSQRPAKKVADAGSWRDKVTAIGQWHAVEGKIGMDPAASTYYCFHTNMGGDRTLLAHLKKDNLIVECADWKIPEGDASREEGGKKFKVRHWSKTFDLGVKDNKLVSVGSARAEEFADKPLSEAAIGGERFVKVTAAPPPATPAGAPALSAREQKWLDKSSEAQAYKADVLAANSGPETGRAAALKAAYEKHRAVAANNMKPDEAKYVAAAAADKATTETIEKEMRALWGGENNTTIVGYSGTNAEVQLSPEEYAKLEAKAKAPEGAAAAKLTDADRAKIAAAKAAFDAYRKVIERWGGSTDPNGAGAFKADYYDPIQLHRAVLAARAEIAGATTAPGNPTAQIFPNLTQEEMDKYLTPMEKEAYKRILESSTTKDPAKDGNLNTQNQQHQALIAARKADSPAPNPVTPANFDALKDWQKRQFCQGRGAMTASAATDRRPGELAANGDARAQLTGVETQARADATGAGTGTAPGTTADPFAEKCKDYRGPAPQTAGVNPGGNNPNPNNPPSPTVTHGPDKEVPAKEKSKWFTQDLLTSGAKGAMVGLLVGSLFGPVGLIAGPILGGLLFYGLTKATSKD